MDDRFPRSLGTALLALHQERCAREAGIGKLLARNAGGRLKVSEKLQRLVNLGLVV
jgi:hypothetical protein